MAPSDSEREIASLDSRMKNVRDDVSKLQTKLETISGTLTEIKSDLRWHWIVGGIVAAAFACVFSFLFLSYIPNQINTRVPKDLSERFGKLEQSVQDMQNSLNKLTPSTLNQLIPAPSAQASPKTIATNLRQASRVIDIALKSTIPSDPALLSQLQTRVSAISAKYPTNAEVRMASSAAEVRIAAYRNASYSLLAGGKPVTEPRPEALSPISLPYAFFADFTINCTHPTAGFLNAGPPSHAVHVTVFDVRVNTCYQLLDGPKWVNVSFYGSKIMYHGGPLYLADVIFTNCHFEFGNDDNSRTALAIISASHGNPVSLLIH